MTKTSRISYISLILCILLNIAILLTITAEFMAYRFSSFRTLLIFLAISIGVTWKLWRPNPLLAFGACLSTLLNTWGWVWRWYREIGWFDELTHFVTPMAVTPIVALVLLKPWQGSESLGSHKVRLAMIVVAVGMAIGALWEIGEWFAYLKTRDPFIIKSLQDTITDMILDLAGSIFCLPIFFHSFKKQLQE